MGEFNRRHDVSLALRTGVHTGPAVAGVIGTTKFIYDLNLASRVESHGVAGKVQVIAAVYERMRAPPSRREARGEIAVRGKGAVSTRNFARQIDFLLNQRGRGKFACRQIRICCPTRISE